MRSRVGRVLLVVMGFLLSAALQPCRGCLAGVA